MTEQKFDKDTYPTPLSIFNPYQRAMNQVIRHVHIDSFKGLEWKNNGD